MLVLRGLPNSLLAVEDYLVTSNHLLARLAARPANGELADLRFRTQAKGHHQFTLAEIASACCHLAALHPAACLKRHHGADGAAVGANAVALQLQAHPVVAEPGVVTQKP